MDEDDTDRICAEFHVTHDPYGAMRAVMRELAQHCIATFSDPTIYDRAGRERAREEWGAAMPPVLQRRSLAEQLGARPVTGPMLTGPRAAANAQVPDATFLQVKEPRTLREGRELLDRVDALAARDDPLRESDTLLVSGGNGSPRSRTMREEDRTSPVPVRTAHVDSMALELADPTGELGRSLSVKDAKLLEKRLVAAQRRIWRWLEKRKLPPLLTAAFAIFRCQHPSREP